MKVTERGGDKPRTGSGPACEHRRENWIRSNQIVSQRGLVEIRTTVLTTCLEIKTLSHLTMTRTMTKQMHMVQPWLTKD